MNIKRLDPDYHYDCGSGEEQFLVCCPHCGGEFTHHDCADHYERREDHIPRCTRIGTPTKPYMIDPDIDENEVVGPIQPPAPAPAHNPSGRRTGIRIWLYCEQCAERFALQIAQHKGNTFLALTKGILKPHIPIMDQPGLTLARDALDASVSERDEVTRRAKARKSVIEAAIKNVQDDATLPAPIVLNDDASKYHEIALSMPEPWGIACLWAFAEIERELNRISSDNDRTQ